MYLTELQARLIDLARKRVRSGQVTERGLAKLCGLSQPHLHNLLKGVRSLSGDSSDKLMRGIEVTVADLVWSAPDSSVEVRSVPILRHRLGPGTELSMALQRGTRPFSVLLLAGLVDPVAAYLGPDLALPRPLVSGDLVLLDQSVKRRREMKGGGPWVVAVEGGLRVRYVMVGEGVLRIRGEDRGGEPGKWSAMPLEEKDPLEIVVARVAWMGRKIPEVSG